jgi:hypothetical protein
VQIFIYELAFSLLALPGEARILRDFDPWVIGLFLYKDFLKDESLACVET